MEKQITLKLGRKFLLSILKGSNLLLIMMLLACNSFTSLKNEGNSNDVPILTSKADSINYFNEEIRPYLNAFNSIHSSIDTFGWEEVSYYYSSSHVTIEVFKVKNDTIIDLGLFIAISDSTNDKKYINTYYDKHFKVGSVEHHLYLKDFTDTLYYYTNPVNDKEDMSFLTGKYKFLFENGLLSGCQFRFFLHNEDSLTSIKGNDLPHLPESDCD